MTRRGGARGRAASVPAVVVVICLVMAVPAGVAGVAWWWLERPAPIPDPPDALSAPHDAADARGPVERGGGTPLMSMRRTPGPIVAQVVRDADQAILDDLGAALRRGLEALGVPAGRGCAVVRDGAFGVEVDGRRALVPGGLQQLLVAAVALEVLGPDHRFVTSARSAPLVDGVLQGDLYLVGTGDPSVVTADMVDELRVAVPEPTLLDELADRLVAAGLTRVDGDVVGDGTRYDDEYVVPTWDPAVRRRDAGPYDALLVNEGRLYASGYGLNPSQAAASELNRLLVERGVVITGRNRAGAAPDGLVELVSIESAPLTTTVEQLLAGAAPNHAELLVKEIGAVRRGEGSRSAGLEVIRDELETWGVELTGVVLEDGSGLSAQNRLTCDAVVDLIDAAPTPRELVAALPADGVQGSGGLAGIVPLHEGRRLTFAVIVDSEGAAGPEGLESLWPALAAMRERYPADPPDPATFGPR